jgi:lipopolysaccharide transport system permease protein
MAIVSSESAADPTSLATWDLVRGLLDWRLWAFLGFQDIKQRYRRSALGPLWLALGLGVTILGIGILYSQILKTASGNYIPYLALSLLIWNFIASVITESTSVFQGAGHVITSVKIPYTSFILRAITRNIIVAAHAVIVVIIAFVWFQYPVGMEALASVLGLILVCANLYWIALLVAIVSARYRDMAQIITYTMQISLFLTPIIWMPTAIRPGSPYMALNPFAHLLQVIRAPIFDHRIPMHSFLYVGAMLVVGMAATLFVFVRSRRYLVYWI